MSSHFLMNINELGAMAVNSDFKAFKAHFHMYGIRYPASGYGIRVRYPTSG